MRAARRPAATRHDRRHKSRGQSFVEFAIVAPVLLLLLLITLDFGRMFLSYVTLNNTVRVAANYAALNPSDFTGTLNLATYNSIVNRESSSLNCPLRADGGGNTPPIPTYPGGTGLGKQAVVQMTCDFSPLTPLIGAIVGNSFPISAESQFPVRTGAIANISGSTTLPPPGAPVAAFTFTGVTGGTINGSGNVTGTDPVDVTVLDGSTNAQTYDWNWGDGSQDDFTAAPLPHTFTGSQLYTVTLTVTNNVGSSTATRTVDLSAVATPTPATPTPTLGPPVRAFFGTPIGNAPQVTGGGSAGVAIQGSYPSLQVNFTNNTTNATAYSWNFGDGSPVSTATNPGYTYSSKGVFTVTLTVTTPTGAQPLQKVAYVTVGCVVPNFSNTATSAAPGTWSGAGMTGTITYQPVGAKGNQGQTTTPPAVGTIKQQSLTGGVWVDPAKKGNNPYCGSDILVRWQ
jgi:PKD repeat protein